PAVREPTLEPGYAKFALFGILKNSAVSQAELLRHAEILVGAEIPGLQARRDDDVPAGVSESEIRRSGETTGVVPALDAPLRAGQVAVRDAIRGLERARV